MIEVTRWKRRDGTGGIVEAILWMGRLDDVPQLQAFGCTESRCMINPWDGRVAVDDRFQLCPGEWLMKAEDGCIEHYRNDEFQQLFEPAEEGR